MSSVRCHKSLQAEGHETSAASLQRNEHQASGSSRDVHLTKSILVEVQVKHVSSRCSLAVHCQRNRSLRSTASLMTRVVRGASKVVGPEGELASLHSSHLSFPFLSTQALPVNSKRKVTCIALGPLVCLDSQDDTRLLDEDGRILPAPALKPASIRRCIRRQGGAQHAQESSRNVSLDILES